MTGLSIGSRFARSQPGSVVLVIAVELCTLAFRADRGSKADVVSSALFGDGAAAAVLRANRATRAIALLDAAREHTWPATLDIMGWSVDPIGFGVVLPAELRRSLACTNIIENMMGTVRRVTRNVKRWSSPSMALDGCGQPLRHDAFEPQFAGVPEHGGAVFVGVHDPRPASVPAALPASPCGR